MGIIPSVRRLARVLLNALTVLSLILCVSTVVFWVRSYWVADLVHLRKTDRWHYANAAGGRLATGG
jgi:hypothetical protein